MTAVSVETAEPAGPKIHPDVRREHVVKLAAVANSTSDLTAYIVRLDGEISVEISHDQFGHSAEVTVILHCGFPRFAWTTDHDTIGAVDDITATLGVVRHELVMRSATCRE